MNANPGERPTSNELHDTLKLWYGAIRGYKVEKREYGGKDIKAIFEEADKEIANIVTSYKANPDAIYASRAFSFSNLPKPVNSSVITSYLDEEENGDSQLCELGVASSSLSNDVLVNNNDLE
ncbi:unnamed protein product [Rhizophagus irregularis]|nr:unnamed protein product [Rhizophagus irregularis]CAB5183165.1 unnamed protein product [Rhizophagus irregularis]CAB5360045.1 unnamed protein product [Rhizophagus irregularis]